MGLGGIDAASVAGSYCLTARKLRSVILSRNVVEAKNLDELRTALMRFFGLWPQNDGPLKTPEMVYYLSVPVRRAV
jgi:hypothetical protein